MNRGPPNSYVDGEVSPQEACGRRVAALFANPPEGYEYLRKVDTDISTSRSFLFPGSHFEDVAGRFLIQAPGDEGRVLIVLMRLSASGRFSLSKFAEAYARGFEAGKVIRVQKFGRKVWRFRKDDIPELDSGGLDFLLMEAQGHVFLFQARDLDSFDALLREAVEGILKAAASSKPGTLDEGCSELQ